MPDLLDGIRPPALPIPLPQYDQKWHNATSNVLRIFFNRLIHNVNALTGEYGTQHLDTPNGLFFSTTNQTLTLVNTGYPVLFPLEYLNHGVTVNSTGEILIAINGVYNFQFSGQIKSTSSSTKQIWIWIVRNGTAIGYSTHQYTLSGNDNHMNVSWNFNIDMQAGQHLQLYWASDSTSVYMEASTATSPHPGIPSAVMAVNYVAPLPDPLPTPP